MLLEIENLRKHYRGDAGAVMVLDGVNLALDDAETVALTGESGSGKSTVLHLIAGLDTADAGTIRVDGQDVLSASDADRAALRRSRVGLVFQQFNLIPSLDVAGNLAFQARLAGRYDPDVTRHLAERLGLADLMSRYPEQLSGGQQQRVAIGRTLAVRPRLVLADEPTGNLDEATSDIVLDLLLALVRDSGAGLLMVTHSDRLASRLGRRVRLSKGEIG